MHSTLKCLLMFFYIIFGTLELGNKLVWNRINMSYTFRTYTHFISILLSILQALLQNIGNH